MDKHTVFSKEKTDFTKEYMFFGAEPNVARYDVQRDSVFEKLITRHHSFFWLPQEISLVKDRNDFKTLTDHEQSIFIRNISYQTLVDSIQGRAPSLAFLPFVSTPELETLIDTWTFSETIHSRSYTHIIRNLINKPETIFNNIVDNPDIVKRSEEVAKYYDDLIEYGRLYKLLGEGTHTVNDEQITVTLRELKKKLMLCMVCVNILEGVRFYVSFVCSFAFAELGKMEGNAKTIGLISRDEKLHLAITQNVLNKWRKGQDDPEMEELFRELTPEITQMYLDAVEQEKSWAEYLFAEGSMIGLNVAVLCDYVEYIATQRMRSIGLKSPFHQTFNPLSWSSKYLESSNKQPAPQETEIESYLQGGGISKEFNLSDFNDIEL